MSRGLFLGYKHFNLTDLSVALVLEKFEHCIRIGKGGLSRSEETKYLNCFPKVLYFIGK